ncbi:helix-turn-helix domain-containing protein [Gilvimarinus xylanilyticus]|uniref:Helix-turn-helix domain-containing protein n=1 Tax=Gilvimarinus xylanilyticus TaxID=2944139 RepID=A0A9X2KT90_9GAMM|nr:helix-turn-helix domain-containing protein [Gilvimarinus xylanilyticus]MCP8898543.1 helix-turn-helix domain-containing protein [Gilvimarinus xylanilyticus]
MSDLSAQLGLKLKAIREANGLSQRELAKRAGVTNSSISMIEQGQVSPSIQSLEKVLAGFPMTLSYFFSCGVADDSESFFSPQEMPRHSKPYGYMQMVAEQLPQRRVTLKHLCFEPGTNSGDAPLTSFFDQVGSVFSGRILLSIGVKVQTLEPGDSFYLRAYTPFKALNLSQSERAVVLVASAAED